MASESIFEAVDKVKAISGTRVFAFSIVNLRESLSRFFFMIIKSVSTLANAFDSLPFNINPP